jgi:hypothetical protein
MALEGIGRTTPGKDVFFPDSYAFQKNLESEVEGDRIEACVEVTVVIQPLPPNRRLTQLHQLSVF